MSEHMDRFARETADKLDKGLHHQTMADDLATCRAEHAEMAALLAEARAYERPWHVTTLRTRTEALLARIRNES